MKQSTLAVFQKHGWRVDRAIHNILYFIYYAAYVRTALIAARFVAAYLSWCKPLSPIARAIFARYHSKVITPRETNQIFTLGESVSLISPTNTRVVPFKYAHKIIFQEPEHVVVMDCPCKLATGSPPETIQSCLAVGKNLSQFWLDHCRKYNPERISQEDALALIRKMRRKGHVTQAFFKVATGGSTGVICNCHPDSCVSFIATRAARKLASELTMNAASGYSVQELSDNCRHDGKCMEICPVQAIRVTSNDWTYNRHRCLGCGLCVEHCQENRLSLVIDAEKPLPLDMDWVQQQIRAEAG